MYNLLFDFDGTLFDTDSTHELAFQKTFTTFSLGECPPYESLKGICYFHNNIDRKELPEITKFLQGKFNGKEMEKGERIFLKGSDEIFSSKDIGQLAKDLEVKLNAKAIISLEFEDISADALKQAGMPESKLLPIPK